MRKVLILYLENETKSILKNISPTLNFEANYFLMWWNPHSVTTFYHVLGSYKLESYILLWGW